MSRNASAKSKKIAVLIPCLNEAENVGAVIDAYHKALPAARIYVCDNGSTDATAKIAKKHGAIVCHQKKLGKGRALKTLFQKSDADCYVLADGDDSYKPTNVRKMVKLVNDGCDMVVGVRDSVSGIGLIRRFGNKLAHILLRARTNLHIKDPLCGYRALSRKFVKAFPCQSEGFAIEVEMSIFAAKHNMKYAELPIKLKNSRKSSSKLKTFRDGIKIFGLLSGINRRLIFIAGIFSILFVSVQILGSKISPGSDILTEFNSVDIAHFVIGIAIAFVVTCTSFMLYDALNIRLASQNKKRKALTIKFWIVTSLIMFLIWFGLFIFFIPGVVTVDSVNQLHQVFGNSHLNNDHPILHTLFINVFMFIGSIFSPDNATAGVMIFSLAQMLILAALLSYICYWLAKTTKVKTIGIIAAVYFSINPMIAYSSFAMLKDTLFSAAVAFLITVIIDIIRSKGNALGTNSGMRKLLLSVILVTFLRNNGILISVVAMIGIAVIYGKPYRSFILKTLTGITLVYLLITAFSSLITQNNFTESAAVPLQQVAYSSKHGVMDQPQKDFFNNILDTDKMAESYDPTSVDYIKWHEAYNKDYLNNHQAEFLFNWAKLGARNIPQYLASYALLTEPLWNIGNPDWAFDYYGNVGDLDQVSVSEINIFSDNQRQVITDNLRQFQTTPLGIIIDAGFLIWCMWLVLAYIIYRKNSLLPLAPLAILWLTLMLTAPAPSNLRYCFAFCLALPIVLVVPLLSTSKKSSII